MSVKKIAELRQKRAELVNNTRSHLDASEARAVNGIIAASDMETYTKMEADVRALGAQIEAHERQSDLDRQLASQLSNMDSKDLSDLERNDVAMRKFFIEGDRRNLQSDNSVSGGYTVMPTTFSGTLLKFVDDEVFIRRLATVEKVVKAESLGIVSLDSDPSDAEWTSELSTGDDDAAMGFGKRSLTPKLLVKRIRVSTDLLTNSSQPIESLIAQRLAYKIGVTEEKAAMTGNGANKYLGLFVASENGIPTSRDFSAGNDATSIKFDGLKTAMYGVKSQYMKSGAWLFHRDAMAQISKLKDGNGQYIWQVSTQVGEPDMLLGRPIYMSEFAPNTFTTGQYVGMFGDFKKYMIADNTSMSVQVLRELYALTNEIGVIARIKTDGMPVLAEAFARVKLA